MKILMVLEHEYPEDERVLKEIKTLQNSGHTVTLACATKENRSLYELTDSVEIIRKPISKFIAKTSVGALKFPFYFNFWLSFINSILAEKSYDAIHIHDLPLAKVGFVISRKHNMKFVLDLHENWPVLLDLSPHTKSFLGRILSSNRQWLKYEKKYASLADGLIVVAEEMKQRLLNRNVVNKNIAVVPNTSNIDIFEKNKEIKPDPDFITLYYAGGITLHRGLDIVIKGLSEMELPDNFRFRIIGRGRNEPFLKELTKELNLQDKVFFSGWKSHKEVIKLLFKSDIAVIPHLRNEHTDNTSPNKIFHYMLTKKPILSSDCTYLKNIINETNAGLVYSDRDSSEFAEKLSRLIKNSELRTTLGENGFKAAIEKYNWKKTSETLVQLYEKIS